MARQLDYRSTSPYPAEKVYATMVDPDYLRARLRDMGGPGAELLEHTADTAGASYRLRHGVDAKNLPGAVRGLFSTGITIERSERWTREDSGRYRGNVEVTVAGAPGSAAGGMRLCDVADGGSEFQVHADITVNVPLIGGKIEGFVTEQMQNLLADESAFTQRWLNDGH
jgi:hypothetical protein